MTAPPSTPPLDSPSEDWEDFVAAHDHPALEPNNKASPPSSPLPPSPSTTPTPSSSFSTPSHPSPIPGSPSSQPLHPSKPLQAFHKLDPVQRYALGALATILLNLHANDLNGIAFARTHAITILLSLGLSPTQQTALLALDPNDQDRLLVLEQCVDMVGHYDARFEAIQAMLALAVAGGKYDARSRAFLASVAEAFGISWCAVAAVELAVAVQLIEDTDGAADHGDVLTVDGIEDGDGEGAEEGHGEEVTDSALVGAKTVDELLIARRKKKKKVTKAMKITGITLAGGLMFGLTGGLIAPALLSALAGVGVASAAGLAASGTVASASVVGGLFGVAGAGFTVKKARNRVSTNLEEFDFERVDDPRVIEEREKKMERMKKKMEKLVAERLREEAEMNGSLAIEAAEEDRPGEIDIDKELPRPIVASESEDEFEDEHSGKSKKYRPFTGKKKKKKREKLKVGPRGLEAASHIASLHVCICVPAWLNERSYGAALDQFEPALKQELPYSQHIALRWESRRLYEMGLAFAKFWASKATVTTIQQTYPHAVAAASTVAGAVAFAFAMPLTVMSCMDYVDNPWSILVSRSNGAGDELADVLVERSYGQRPVTLFGYSIGARVVFKCLESLASRSALGIVDNVFLMGAAVTADPERWKKIRPVVAGRIVNAYGSYDWALAFFHRGCGHGVYISGLRRVELEGVENLNMSYLGIEGHRELKDCVPRVMKAMGIGVGYIVMPPARLVRRRSRTKGHKGSNHSDSPVCEEPERLSNREKIDARIATDSEEGSSSNLVDARTKSGWEMESPSEGGREDRLDPGDELALPPNLAGRQAGTASQASPEEYKVGINAVNGRSKKKKSTSWLSWNPWTGSSHRVRHKSPKRSAGKEEKKAAHGEESLASPVIPAVNSEDMMGRDGNVYEEVDHEVHEEDNEHGEHVADIEDEAGHVEDDVVAVADLKEEGGVEAFDWDKQRMIWEEQERQIEERGYADSAADIEMRNRVVLGVGIEVAGRRICRYVEQDAQLPVERKEEVFTNCVEEQRGVVVRLYEHERRTRSVSVNMLKHDEQYPRLLGEMHLKLKRAAEKGKLRIAVGMGVTEEGDIWADVEERFADGVVGEKTTIVIKRGELCTVEERRRLEAAERKRIEAQLQKEMRSRAQSDVLALPAGEGMVNGRELGKIEDLNKERQLKERTEVG